MVGTNGGHEHGLIALWEMPVKCVCHSSNNKNKVINVGYIKM